jgi:hypothetical protein
MRHVRALGRKLNASMMYLHYSSSDACFVVALVVAVAVLTPFVPGARAQANLAFLKTKLLETSFLPESGQRPRGRCHRTIPFDEVPSVAR